MDIFEESGCIALYNDKESILQTEGHARAVIYFIFTYPVVVGHDHCACVWALRLAQEGEKEKVT